MARLCVAMPEKGSEKILNGWTELSAGTWRNHIDIHHLTDDKVVNDALVSSLATLPNSVVYTLQHLTSAIVAGRHRNIQRFQKYQLREAVEQWLDEHDLNWRTRTKRHCDKTPYKRISADEWASQFAKVNPTFGRRAGAALLSQFQVIGSAEFAAYFSNLPEVEQNTFFIGADPHSGDHALIGILSANIDNGKLHDSRNLPTMKKNAKVRLFCDGSWSGGETQRRIRCMFTTCNKKDNALVVTQSLDIRVGFITDIADTTINRELQVLADAGVVQKGHVRVTYPEGNRLNLIGANSGQKGLAFHDMARLHYVDTDPKALRKLCLQIGRQVRPEQPLGTNEIASCIAFAHSLPAAMLPLFTVDGVVVTGSDGQKFLWKALLRSEHVATGQNDDPEHHCKTCPLADRTPKVPITAAT